MEWTNKRQAWADIEQRHEPVRSLFATLQTLRAELQREAERVELVLGVATLAHQRNAMNYNHPLILKSLGLEFDIRENRFVLSETDKPTELYSESLAELGIDLAPASGWRERLKQLHPLDVETQTLVKSIGDWIRGTNGFADATISLAPVIFLRDRGGWPARAATAVLEDLANKPAAQLPIYLRRLAGIESPRSDEEDSRTEGGSSTHLANEDEEILFALPANMEQLALARQLERKDAVLVQGPPGTGKTHTIANLLGHLLAQGKRVLVTSHTSKALRVLRDKVPENIRSLCVSVIDDPSRSRKELDEAVRAIAERMQEGQTSLRDTVKHKTADRKQLIEEIRQLRLKQRDCVKAEYDEIVIGGEALSPSKAARFAHENASKHDWIPGPLQWNELGKVCPLNIADVESLYRSQQQITEQVEAELRAGLPTDGWLPIHQNRDKLLAALGVGATAWAAAISQRIEYHNEPLPSERDIAFAWRWRQIHDELAYRHQLNTEEIATELSEKNRDLERVTSDLIAESAWSSQLSAAERFRQHLVGWLDFMRRIGKGTGSNAEHYRVQAREQLRNGQHAVPVWIMPMAQVFQSFTAADANFDVVIVDEASQAGLEGLLAAYLGKKIVVVGDHEQVSPDAVGQMAAIAANLQSQFLAGIPNAALYDGQLSLYDLTRQSTSGMLSLSEHFRCVPSIIGFSNQLSYEGRIKPLREASSSKLRPIISHRVNGER